MLRIQSTTCDRSAKTAAGTSKEDGPEARNGPTPHAIIFEPENNHSP